MKIWDLIKIDEDEDFTSFLSRDNRFKGLIRIENRYIKQLKQSIKNEDFSVKDWESMIQQKEVS